MAHSNTTRNVAGTNSREGGQVMLLVTLLLLGGSMAVVGGVTTLARGQVQVVTEQFFAKQTYVLSEGAVEEVVYRHIQGMDVSSTESITVNGITATVETIDLSGGKEVLSTAELNTRERAIEVQLKAGSSDASFYYGLHGDEGGIEMDNSASVLGSVYSNGSIEGHNLEMVYGDVVSAGPLGYVYEIHATGSVYANEIDDALVDGDAYYQTIDVGTVVNGTKHPGSVDQGTTSLPITEAQLDTWALEAEALGVTNSPCPYEIKKQTVSISGKYTCGMKITNQSDVTLDGPVWVVGDLEIENSSILRINASLGDRSLPIIVDDPSDRQGSSMVFLKNSTEFHGSGSDRSFIFVISRNDDASNGGGNSAIDLSNSAAGKLVLYTNFGKVLVQNNTTLNAVAAYLIHLKNSSQVIFDENLEDLLFSSGGGGGGYAIDSWQEVE